VAGPRDKSKKPSPVTGRAIAAKPRAMFEDDRPTEIKALKGEGDSVQKEREQTIHGTTIADMMSRGDHKLSQVLVVLIAKARQDLPGAIVDERASLLLHHEFEFERRVGYRLLLKLFDRKQRCIEVRAEVDADGRAIRSGSMISRTFPI
jgi:hypothetical protein